MSVLASVRRLAALGSPPVTQPADRSWPQPFDLALAGVALVGSLVLLGSGGGVGLAYPRSGHLTPAGIGLVAVATVPLAGWRRSPVGVFTVTASASVLLAALGEVLWPPLGPVVALYLLARSRDEASPWTPRSAGTVAVLLVGYLAVGIAVAGLAGSDVAHAGLAWAAAWFAGERTRLRRDQIAELHRRATRNQQESARERQLAVAEERARIARDLHDSAGHALNVIAVRAGAARLRHARDPQRSW